MKTPEHVDPERLASLLDGRLSDAEADVVRSQLAASDDDVLAAYADAVAVSRDLAEVAGTPNRAQSVKAAPSRGFVWKGSVALAVAAVLLVAVFLKAPSGDSAADDVTAYASHLSFTVESPSSPLWGATRGTGRVVTAAGRSVRVGALVTELELALRRSDSASIATAEEIAAYLSDVPGSGSIANDLRRAARGSSVSRASELRRLMAASAELLNPALVRAGAWIESARFASSAGDSAFFRLFPAQRALEPIRGMVDPGQLAVVEGALQFMRAEPGDFRARRAALDVLLGQLAR